MTYRLSWEMVSPHEMHRFSNADPRYYKNTTQKVPNSEIPDEFWYPISKESDNPWNQFHTLREWAERDEEFVRNVKLEKMVTDPQWVTVKEEEWQSPTG
jgi:hypothetical protein